MSYQLISSDTVSETPELLSLLNSINREINRFSYVSDISQHHQQDYWTSRIELFESGDCDDYTLSKRKRLLEAGVPNNCMFPTICKVSGEGHLVLVVRTDTNDWVLDNLSNKLEKAGSLNYDWIARLDPATGNWLTI